MSFMLSPELQQILYAMEKPILYASRNDYANLKTLKGLESYFSRWLEKAFATPLSRKEQELFRNLKALVEGFDNLQLPAKKGRIQQAQNLLQSLKNEEAALPSPLWPTPSEFKQWRRDLQNPMQYIRGVGPRLAEILKKKNIQTVEDALYFLPRAY